MLVAVVACVCVCVALRAGGGAALLFRFLPPIRLLTLECVDSSGRRNCCDSLRTHAEAGRGAHGCGAIGVCAAKQIRTKHTHTLVLERKRRLRARGESAGGLLLLWARPG